MQKMEGGENKGANSRLPHPASSSTPQAPPPTAFLSSQVEEAEKSLEELAAVVFVSLLVLEEDIPLLVGSGMRLQEPIEAAQWVVGQEEGNGLWGHPLSVCHSKQVFL